MGSKPVFKSFLSSSSSANSHRIVSIEWRQIVTKIEAGCKLKPLTGLVPPAPDADF